MNRINQSHFFARFLGNSDGSITIWSLFNLLLIIGFAALALDVNNASRSRTQLQNTADAAGHAALYARYISDNTEVGAAAGISLAEANMPTSLFGNVLASVDTEFGTWDRQSQTFTLGGRNTAVRVVTRRIESRGNAVSTFLMRFLGIENFNLNTESYWEYAGGICPPSRDGIPGQGFFAIGAVDMQTGNVFGENVCVHSEDFVKLSTGNFFDPSVVISMPDVTDLQLPASGMTNNINLDSGILHSTDYPELYAFFDRKFPDLVDLYRNNYDQEIVLSGGETLDSSMLEAGVNPDGTFLVKCNGGSFSVKQNEIIKGKTIVTDCKVKFLAGSGMEDSTLVTTSTSNDSITGPAGTRWGHSLYCAEPTSHGDVLVITKGGIRMPSDLEMYGVEIFAQGPIQIAAKADGMDGINVVSADTIDVTSNSDFGFCAGSPSNVILPVFRMVK